MAGVRMGYMIARPERIEKINNLTRGGMAVSNTHLTLPTNREV